MGLTYDQTHDIPYGELMDLISIDMVKTGLVTLAGASDEEIIPDVR